MKNLKRLFAIALVLALALTLTIPALAEGDNDNSDTTDTNNESTATTYSIKITAMDNSDAHVFKAYQIFKGTLSSDGTLTDVEWGSDIDTANTTLYSSIKAITYKDLSNNDVSPFANLAQETAASVSDILAGLADNTAAVEAFQEAIAKLVTDNSGTSIDYSANGVYSVDNMSAGYYLIKDKRTDNTNVADMMLRVVGNVEATAKLEVPSVTKYAGEKDVTDNANFSVGDEITYTLEGTTKNYSNDATSYSYTFTDTMDNALDLVYTASTSNPEQVEDGVKVTLGSGENAPDITSQFLITYKDHVLTIASNETFPSTEIKLGTNSTIVVTYTATVNSTAETSTNVNNKVKVTSKVGDDATETPDVTEQVYPITLKITKVDGADNKLLSDAKFNLTRTVASGETTTKQYATTDMDGNFTGWTTDETQAAELTTDAQGQITLVGIGAGTFTLTEIEAPTGYNKLNADVVIKIASTSKTSDTGTVQLESLSYSVNNENNGAETKVTGQDLTDGIVSVTVKNQKGAQLPSTGGIGTTIFYVAGGILVLGAIVLLITRKRMSAE